MKTYLALDSGAFSMYRKSVLGPAEKKNPRLKNKVGSVSSKIAARTRSGDAYYESPEYRDYLDRYVAYAKLHRRKLEYYVTLDAMFDAPRTWAATQELESRGLKPMPVYHYGEDISWLKKYMDHYEYIGIGGIARGVGVARRMKFLKQVFALTHPNGHSDWKLHGFGITSTDFMREMPWYSVDSYSPLALANNGKLQMPALRHRRGQTYFDFTKAGPIIYVSKRLGDRGNAFQKLPPGYQQAFEKYLNGMGLTSADLWADGKPEPEHAVGRAWHDSLKYKRERKEKGTLGTCRSNRSFANLYSYAKTAEALSDLRGEPIRIYFSGSINGTDIDDWMERARQCDFREFCWLGTFFDTATIRAFFERGWYRGKEKPVTPEAKRK